MSAEPIEHGLRGLTEWDNDPPRLWERALDRAGDVPVAVPRPWQAHRWVVPTTAVAALLVFMVGVFAPTLGTARSSRAGAYAAPQPSAATRYGVAGSEEAPSIDLQDVLRSSQGGGGGGWASPFDGLPEIGDYLGQVDAERAVQTGQGSGRAVVRKAMMEIKAVDVRAAALQAQQLLSEPKGEYVESADIDDSNKDRPRADLVLRVDATRLEQVLTQLRELGEVTTERVDGEDVTDQMVDLGARLDSERRVEAELLELLESRENDKLEEILAVRRELNAVRERVERLAAQQDNLSRMVRLARVAVMFRTEVKEPEPEPRPGVWGRFVDRLGAAWDDGLDMLLGTIAGVVRVAVGGAIWFGIAAAAGVVAWRSYRRRHPKPLSE